MPESVSAEYGRVTGHVVDDNAAVILRHRTGALGIAETGFVTAFSPFTIEVHGTTGSLLYGTPERRLLMRTATRGSDNAWTELPIPDDAPTPFEGWVSTILDDTEAAENVALALDLTTLVDAANRSALEGTAVRVAPPEPAAQSGQR
jgi:predicted dehydrogenase